jgi:hypothetical protein
MLGRAAITALQLAALAVVLVPAAASRSMSQETASSEAALSRGRLLAQVAEPPMSEISSSEVAAAAATVRKIRWRVHLATGAPDCFERPILLVNGELSPVLEVVQGEILEVGWLLAQGISGVLHGALAWSKGIEAGVSCVNALNPKPYDA